MRKRGPPLMGRPLRPAIRPGPGSWAASSWQAPQPHWELKKEKNAGGLAAPDVSGVVLLRLCGPLTRGSAAPCQRNSPNGYIAAVQRSSDQNQIIDPSYCIDNKLYNNFMADSRVPGPLHKRANYPWLWPERAARADGPCHKVRDLGPNEACQPRARGPGGREHGEDAHSPRTRSVARSVHNR